MTDKKLQSTTLICQELIMNANCDFQNSLNANANRDVYFISRNIMHRFRSIKWL